METRHNDVKQIWQLRPYSNRKVSLFKTKQKKKTKEMIFWSETDVAHADLRFSKVVTFKLFSFLISETRKNKNAASTNRKYRKIWSITMQADWLNREHVYNHIFVSCGHFGLFVKQKRAIFLPIFFCVNRIHRASEEWRKNADAIFRSFIMSYSAFMFSMHVHFVQSSDESEIKVFWDPFNARKQKKKVCVR